MWSFQLVAPAEISKVEVPAPRENQLAPGEILLRFEAGGVCGSDIPRYLSGANPSSRPAAARSAPLHEVCGRVIASRSERFAAGDLAVGMAVRLDGLAEFMVTSDASMHRLSSITDPVVGVTVQPLATVLNAVQPVIGSIPDTAAAVIGLGSLGILFPHVLKALGASRVVGIDRIDRSDEMSAFGLDQAVCSDSADWSGKLQPEDKPGLVVDAVGHGTRVLAHSVDAAAPDGTIVSFGVPDSDEYVFPLLSFFRKNLRMVAGATRTWPRFLAAAEEYLVQHPELQHCYITRVYRTDQANEAFRDYSRPHRGQLKLVVAGAVAGLPQ